MELPLIFRQFYNSFIHSRKYRISQNLTQVRPRTLMRQTVTANKVLIYINAKQENTIILKHSARVNFMSLLLEFNPG